MARRAQLSLIMLVLGLAACGGGKSSTASNRCPTSGRDVTFPLLEDPLFLTAGETVRP